MASRSVNESEWTAAAERTGLSRRVLFAVGFACIALGVLAIVLPLTLIGSILTILGALLIGSGVIKAGQLVLGRASKLGRRRGWPLILAETALDVALGVLLINFRGVSVNLVVAALGIAFLSEGVILFLMGLHAPTWNARALQWISGAITGILGIVILLRLVENPLAWAGFFVGLKLIVFGMMLVSIAACVPGSSQSILYESDILEPEPAELYAVYFGSAFHLGVFVGDGHVVHYLDDNHVYHVTWEQFLNGRAPQRWTYPDLEPVPNEVVIATALSEVGKTYPYSLLKFNCEHFAIFCKSGGTTRSSSYAQIPASLANVAERPLRGMIAEWNTRVVEWLAFHLGGPSGKQLSLLIRRIGSAVTTALVVREQNQQSAPPASGTD